MATVPSPPTYTTGQVLTAAQMNAISTAFNFFLNPPRVQVRQTTNQSIPNATDTVFTFDTEDQDTDGMHSTVSNTSRFTVVTPGTYLVTASGGVAANATGVRAIYLRKNGVEFAQGAGGIASSTTTFQTSITRIISAVAGDYFECSVYQNSGGALNTILSYFGAVWIGT